MNNDADIREVLKFTSTVILSNKQNKTNFLNIYNE